MARTCKKCLKIKPLSDFYKNKHTCRDCARKIRAEWRKNNPEREKKTSKKYRLKNLRKIKSTQLKCKFGITIEEREALLKKQNGKCLICENTELFTGTLCVDHDHETNKIRGLLCNNCNTGIGKLYDDPFFLAKALEYLRYNNKGINNGT